MVGTAQEAAGIQTSSGGGRRQERPTCTSPGLALFAMYLSLHVGKFEQNLRDRSEPGCSASSLCLKLGLEPSQLSAIISLQACDLSHQLKTHWV